MQSKRAEDGPGGRCDAVGDLGASVGYSRSTFCTHLEESYVWHDRGHDLHNLRVVVEQIPPILPEDQQDRASPVSAVRFYASGHILVEKRKDQA